MPLWPTVLMLTLASSLTCNQYMCSPATLPLAPETCAYGVESGNGATTVYLQECGDEEFSYCPPLTEAGNSTCAVPPATPLFMSSAPGEPCQLDMDCIQEGICTGGICTNPGNMCTNQLSCDPGKYCNITLEAGPWSCVPQVGPGASCSADYMCGNAYGCTQDKGCAQYLSIGPAVQVDTCTTGVNSLCQFLRCYSDKEGSYCAANLTSASPLPVYCQSSKDCMVNSAGHNFTSNCECSYGTRGNSYCSLFPGDYPYSQLMVLMQSWLSNPSINSCNTARRTALPCITSYLPANQSSVFLYYYYFSSDFPAIQDMDQCARAIYDQSYWLAYQVYTDLTPNNTQNEAGMKLQVAALIALLAW